MIDLTISIVSSDNMEQLSDCLASIYNTCPPSIGLEVALVNNASARDWSALTAAFPRARIIRSDRPIGYAAAHNLAIASSTGRYHLIMNDDMLVHDGTLEQILRYLDDHPQAGALGCRLTNADGSLQISSFLSYPSLLDQAREALLVNMVLARIPPLHHRFTMYGRANSNGTETRSVCHLMGAFIVVRREVLESVGPLDPHYFFSFEDIDWCWRIRQRGWSVVYLPRAVVVHFGSQTLGKRTDRMLGAFYAGRLRFEAKRGGQAAALALQGIILLELVNKTLLHSVLARLIPGGAMEPARARQRGLAAAFRLAILQRIARTS
jgi:GT2 family glycosyltransferase